MDFRRTNSKKAYEEQVKLFKFIIYYGLLKKLAVHRGYWSQLQKRSSTNSFLIESQKTVIVFHSVVSLHSMRLQSVVGNQITHGLLPAACRRVPRVRRQRVVGLMKLNMVPISH